MTTSEPHPSVPPPSRRFQFSLRTLLLLFLVLGSSLAVFGAGDFRAMLRGTGHKIQRLSLARIDGKVAKDGDSPDVTADYVRLWDWGLFTFMNYGNDKSNPKWVALRKVEPKDAYSHAPNQAHYEQRLGKR